MAGNCPCRLTVSAEESRLKASSDDAVTAPRYIRSEWDEIYEQLPATEMSPEVVVQVMGQPVKPGTTEWLLLISVNEHLTLEELVCKYKMLPDNSFGSEQLDLMTWKESKAAGNSLVTILREFAQNNGGRPHEWRDDVWHTVANWGAAISYTGRFKALKSLLVNMQSLLLRQPLVSTPFLDFPFRGGLRVFWRNLCHRGTKYRRARAAQSLVGLKGLFPEATKRMQQLALEGAFAKLTRCPENDLAVRAIDWSERQGCYISAANLESKEILYGSDNDPHPTSVFRWAVSQIQRTVREVYGDCVYRPDYKVPSSSSHSLAQHILPIAEKSSNSVRAKVLEGVLKRHQASREFGGALELLRHQVDLKSCPHCRGEDLEEHICPYRLHFSVQLVDDRSCPVKLIGLPEAAFKTRVISTGPAMTYTALRKFQKSFWHFTKKPVFRLSGGPVSRNEAFISERLGSVAEDEEYVSIDYSDTTNEINPMLTEAAANAVCEQLGLTPSESQLICGSLIGACLEHPLDGPKAGISIPGTLQSWGQLMGHPLSFPLLCVINAALLRGIYEEFYRVKLGRRRFRISLRACPLLVNGDDACLRAPSGYFGFARPILAHCGLITSPGKTWVSKDVVTINSEMFVPGFFFAPLRRVACPNLGNLYPQNHKRGDFSKLRDMQQEGVYNIEDLPDSGRLTGDQLIIADRYWSVIENVDCPEEIGRLTTQFIRLNREMLDASCGKISWFAPREAGGLGFWSTPWGGVRHTMSDALYVAHWLVERSVNCFELKIRSKGSDFRLKLPHGVEEDQVLVLQKSDLEESQYSCPILGYPVDQSRRYARVPGSKLVQYFWLYERCRPRETSVSISDFLDSAHAILRKDPGFAAKLQFRGLRRTVDLILPESTVEERPPVRYDMSELLSPGNDFDPGSLRAAVHDSLCILQKPPPTEVPPADSVEMTSVLLD